MVTSLLRWRGLVLLREYFLSIIFKFIKKFPNGQLEILRQPLLLINIKFKSFKPSCHQGFISLIRYNLLGINLRIPENLSQEFQIPLLQNWPIRTAIHNMKWSILCQKVPVKLLDWHHFQIRGRNLKHLVLIIRVLSPILVFKPRTRIIVLLQVIEEWMNIASRIKVLVRLV